MMYNVMVSISTSVVGLLLTFQGTQAYLLNITNNHNSTEIEKVSNHSLDIEKLRSLEDSLRILQQKVTELSSQISKKYYTIYIIDQESKKLQIDLNNFQKELNNTVTKEHPLIIDYLDNNNMVDIFYNLTEQKSYLDLQIKEEKESAKDCIREVEYRFIYEPGLFLSLTTYCSEIEYIVKQLSVDEVFYLSERIRNISKRFLFYKTIIKGVNKFHAADNRLDYIIRLIRSVKEEIIDQPKTPQALRSEAIEFHNDLSSQLQSLLYSKLDLYPTPHCNDSDL
ncbi:uncharacterized protein isoform X1 [Rhodnius prolixus]|uniref:uncharacterized protein isoform X1 n=1 Tax=Rhodnius prolixus TaxID=13249 RepID=UPI003D18A513